MRGVQYCIDDIANKNCAFTDQTGLSVLPCEASAGHAFLYSLVQDFLPFSILHVWRLSSVSGAAASIPLPWTPEPGRLCYIKCFLGSNEVISCIVTNPNAFAFSLLVILLECRH